MNLIQILRYIVLAILTFTLVWLIGFLIFMFSLPSAQTLLSDDAAPVEAVVVFTGDAGRVDAGLDVLEDFPYLPVLISGVHPRVYLSDLVGDRALGMDGLARLTLDHTAQTTRQNVAMTRKWMEKRGFKRVGLVTSDYHMLRSRGLMALFGGKIDVVPLPVESQASFSFLWREYAKLWVFPFLD